MTKLFGLLCFLFVSGFRSSAQNDSLRIEVEQGSSCFFLSNAWHFFNFPGMNQALASYSFPAIGKTVQSYGAGAFGSSGKFIFGGMGFGSGNDQTNDSGTVRLQGGMGIFFVGYAFYLSPHLRFMPCAGGGYGGFTASIMKEIPSRSIGFFLSNPNTAGLIGIGSLFYHLSGTLQYRMLKKNSFVFALHGGYNFAGNSAWNADNFSFSDSPSDSFSNYFISLNLGVSIGKN